MFVCVYIRDSRVLLHISLLHNVFADKIEKRNMMKRRKTKRNKKSEFPCPTFSFVFQSCRPLFPFSFFTKFKTFLVDMYYVLPPYILMCVLKQNGNNTISTPCFFLFEQELSILPTHLTSGSKPISRFPVKSVCVCVHIRAAKEKNHFDLL